MTIFECYGHGETGMALVSAPTRQVAVLACYEWLGWDVTVAWRAPERYTLWQNAGGTAATPVVFATDEQHYEVLILRRGG